VTWLDLPNWVGHLITKYSPAPRYSPSAEEQDEEYVKSPMLVYNHAKAGDTVYGVVRQVRKFLSSAPGWALDNSLFSGLNVTFLSLVLTQFDQLRGLA
jgi:hypothetical protein